MKSTQPLTVVKVRNKVINPLLECEIKNVLRDLGLPTDFTLELRGYSKTYLGRYFPSDKRIVLYVLNEEGNYEPYKLILGTAIHEAIHHFQYMDKSFKRVKGVMHDCQFKKLENKLLEKLEDMLR